MDDHEFVNTPDGLGLSLETALIGAKYEPAP